jgi:membrane protease YdiL (CAAX protease family)
LQPTSPKPSIPRSLQFALFLLGGLWVFASHLISASAAQGIVTRLNVPIIEAFLEQACFLFLLVLGFTILSRLVVRGGGLRSANALPKRPTSKQEWQRGFALGWLLALAALIPMMLAGALHPEFWLAFHFWGLAIISIATLALASLAIEIAYRGYIFRRLISATGPVAATIVISLIYAIASTFHPNSTSTGVAISFMLGVLLSVAYLRTNALWLGWGLHFAWMLTLGVLIGLPVAGDTNFSSLITTSVFGPDWLTGGPYGPEGAVITLAILIAAVFPLYRITRNYAWNYTHTPIEPKGYALEIAPSAAHVAMENSAAAAPAPLVQILSTTPSATSTMPVIDEHLRKSPASRDTSAT